MKVVLGINAAFHDSSAAVAVDGRLKVLVEDERYSRVRHAKRAAVDNTAVLPYRAIDEALRCAGLTYAQVDSVAYGFDPETRLGAVGRLPGDPGVPPDDYGSPEGERRFHDFMLLTGPLLRARYGREAPVRFMPHHDCHLAAAYYSCPWDEAALLTVDGIGEYDTATWARGSGGRVEKAGSIPYPHSLGFLWERVTQWLGLVPNLDEGTAMALAAFGAPARLRGAMRRILWPMGDGSFRADPVFARFRAPDVTGLERAFGPRRRPDEPLLYQGSDRRHAHVAAALQELTEEVLTGLAHRVRSDTDLPRLALSGGVALNCLANAAIARCGAFDELWAFPAASDCGTAFGAAMLGSLQEGVEPVREEWQHAFLGPAEPRGGVDAALRELSLDIPALESRELVAQAAELLAAGKTLAWYEGAMEVGPRALCHRSILADPRSVSMRDRLNLKVKHRQPFRPYGPVLRLEDAGRYFDIPSAALRPCRFMLAAVPVKTRAKGDIPAVLHADGTTRPQLVTREVHPRLYDLLGAFGAKTGHPVLVNTSFNDREPIVATPAHALATYLRTEIDALVLEDRLLVKKKSNSGLPNKPGAASAGRRATAGPPGGPAVPLGGQPS